MGESFRNNYGKGNDNSCGFLVPSYFKKKKLGGVWAGDKPLDSISLCFYGDSTGIRMWNNPNDPMPVKIANGKTLQECIYYQGGGITVYTDNSVTVKSYPGFYDYYLANERKMTEIMMLPIEGEEVVKDEEYYEKLINELATNYNKQVENAPNLYRNTMVLQDVNTPAPIDFACTVFVDKIWIGEGYSVGTVDRPPCPVNVPSGKLGFETHATSEGYSFVGKNFIKEDTSNYAGFYQLGTNTGAVERVFSNSATTNGVGYSYVISKTYKGCKNENSGLYNLATLTSNNSTEGFIDVGRRNHIEARSKSFTQLLIYKGNLTETDLKGELAKDIKLR